MIIFYYLTIKRVPLQVRENFQGAYFLQQYHGFRIQFVTKKLEKAQTAHTVSSSKLKQHLHRKSAECKTAFNYNKNIRYKYLKY